MTRLKTLARPALLLRLGCWACMCMRRGVLPGELKARIRPWTLFGYACWCDRSNPG